MKTSKNGVTYGKATRFGMTWILYLDESKKILFVAPKPNGMMLISEMEEQWIPVSLLADHFINELQSAVYSKHPAKLSVFC